jgi:hypothetical protein
LERVGGIIRDAASKEIVAWLRESGKLVVSEPEVTTSFLHVLQNGSGGLAPVAELLIEYLQRLEGYELEIATLRMSVQEWDKLTDLEEHDFAAIVDLDLLVDLGRVGHKTAS